MDLNIFSWVSNWIFCMPSFKNCLNFMKWTVPDYTAKMSCSLSRQLSAFSLFSDSLLTLSFAIFLLLHSSLFITLCLVCFSSFFHLPLLIFLWIFLILSFLILLIFVLWFFWGQFKAYWFISTFPHFFTLFSF